MNKIPGTNLIIVGFWDKCFFKRNSDSGGLRVSDNGIIKNLTYREIRKILKENSKNA